MKQLFINNAHTTISSSILSTDLTITVATGTGGLFPNPTVGQQYFLATLEGSGAIEIVRCTARVGDVLTLDTRGMEGTTPTAFPVGTEIECRVTASTLAAFTKTSEMMLSLTSVDSLVPPATMGSDSCICHSNDNVGNPIVAIKTTSTQWSFSTHKNAILTCPVTTGTNTSTQVTSTALGSTVSSPVAGQYLIQFTTGSLAGYVRTITSSGSNTLTWATPLPYVPAAGTDSFYLYKSDVSIISDLQTSVSNLSTSLTATGNDALAFAVVFG